MEFNENLAEIVGIMLGDGCLYKEKRSNKYQVAVCLDKKEQDYLHYVKKLFEEEFSYKFCITNLGNANLLRNGSVKIGEILVELGLKPGNKVANEVEIPLWIFLKERYVIKAIRGLFDTDGCVYRKYDRYAQIHFKFGSIGLISSLHDALEKLGFSPTKIERGVNKDKNTMYWKFYLCRQKEVDAFFRRVNPKNQKHITRFKEIRTKN